MDVGEAALNAVVFKGELFVVEAEEVEHLGVQVMEGMDVFGCLESELICGTMADAGFDDGTGEDGGESAGLVVTAFGSFLEHGHAAKFGAPKNQRIIQHTAMLEVPDESG